LVYLDESGFEEASIRGNGWSKRGEKIYGSHSGRSKRRTNLIVAKCGKQLLALVLFQGSTKAQWFNHWLQTCLFKELPKNATVILDNAAFHKTAKTRQLFEESPYNILYLLPYSPDLDPIEKVFAHMKKRRQFNKKDQSIDYIVKTYNSYLE
jgi:transposase